MNLEKNAQAMEKAVKRVKAVEITRAVRGTRLNGLEIKKGQFIAMLNGEDLIARADEVGDVVLEALGKAGAEKAEIVTIYYGAEIKVAEARKIAQEIRDRYRTEVEVIYGGQPHYNYIISLE
jgi:dihydroxyacetone kinase-like predicted kinase